MKLYLKRFLHKYRKAAVLTVALLLPLLSITISNAYLSSSSVLTNKFSLKKSLVPLLAAGSTFNAAIPTTATRIVFTDASAPDGSTTVDLSDEQDRGVVGWLSGTTWYVSSQQSGVSVVANADSSDMFKDKTALTSIDFSNLDTSKVTNMSSMFANCTSLTTQDLSKLNTSSVTDMSSMFNGCSGITSLDLTSFDTSKVTAMQGMFQGCASLTSLNVSKFNTASVTNFSSMFNGCQSLTSLDVTGFNTAQATNMSAMFDSCSSLKSIDLSKFNTAKVTNLSRLFQNCSALEKLDLSSFDTSKATDLSNMFTNCKKLTTIYAAANPTVSSVNNSSNMFLGCDVLKGKISYDSSKVDVNYFNFSGYLKNTNPSVILKTGAKVKAAISTSATKVVFTDTAAPSTATLKDLSQEEDEGVVGWLSGTTYYISTQRSGKKIKANADSSKMFLGRSKLTTIDFSNLDTSDVTDMSYMFAGETYDFYDYLSGKTSTSKTVYMALTSLDLSNFNTSKVTSMKGMFENCSELTSLNISSFDTSNVTDMSWMFEYCMKLPSIDVSKFVTNKVTDMAGMFGFCEVVSELDVSKFNTANVTDTSWMFGHCKQLSSINLLSFNTKKVTRMGWMFQYCTITTLDLSSFDTSNVTDMRFMISHCSNLTTIYATSNPDVSKVTQGGAMFDSSSKLKGAISYNVSKITYAYFNFDGYLTKETSSKAPAKHAAEEETSSQLLTGNELNQLIPETATSIVFTDEEAPSDTEVLDLSALQDGSIAGWMEDSVWYMSTQSEDVQILANADSSYMFSNRPELTSIDLSNLDTSNVTDMSSMFENDSSLSKIDLSSLDMSSVEKMDNMFAGCQSLVSIYVLEDPNLSSSSFGEGMFAGCINLAGSISYDSEKTSSEYFCLDGYLSLKEETELDENRNEQLLN